MLTASIQRYTILLLMSLSGLAQFKQVHAQPHHNANHLVAGIMSYTSWDNNKDQLTFCKIDGPAQFITSNIFNPPSPLIQPNTVKIINITSNELINTPNNLNNYDCDVLYFVSTEDYVQQKIISLTSSRYLSISENNPECTIGSSFCLNYRNQKFSFQVNLNSLKKSRVRVNSKVLMLSQLGGDSQ